MPDQYYQVVPINVPPRETEGRGSRRKFWVLGPDNQTDWLLKFPRPDTGEHWAEKLAAEIGRLVNVNTALVELAQSGPELATICQSFLLAADDSHDYPTIVPTWYHGSEFLDLAIPNYDISLVWSNRRHNVKNIITAIVHLTGVGSTNPMPCWDTMMEQLASYAFLDGLIGNTDRHHENWMVAYVEDAGDNDMRIAPSFDHASSLGRELDDTRHERILASNGVLDYLQKGRGGVFVDNTRYRAPSPLHLAQMLCRWKPALARNWSDQLNSIPDAEFRSVIDNIPPQFMSDVAKEVAYQIVITSKIELLRSVR